MTINGIQHFFSDKSNTFIQSDSAIETNNRNDAEDASTGTLRPPGVVTTISQEALEALSTNNASSVIDLFLSENGERLYNAAIKGLKTYPEDLALALDDKSLSQAEQTENQNALTEREFNAFAKYAKQSPPDFKLYYEKYVEYLDSLSPAEQNSSRYSGQRDEAVRMYERIAKEAGEEPKDLSSIQDPILALFEAIREQDFNIQNKELLRERYEKFIAPLLDNEETPELEKELDQVLLRFDAVQSVIDAAKDGDKTAMGALQNLVNNPDSIDDFLGFSNTLNNENG